ncbi:MAG TPA: YihY/virulence factor BrkB family protein [Gemmatimonadaceae bacterium]|nr:YihY/virulence factor BrkB family protein [Gemmatimonadaceae bacterium]
MPTRSLPVRFWWTLRDYAKRVWDNAGEDNIFFLTGGITFNILLAAVPFFLLLLSGLGYLLNQDQAAASIAVWAFVDALLPQHSDSAAEPLRRIIDEIIKARGQVGLIGLLGFVWFSTRLFGSLRTVLAEVFDIEDTRGIVGGKVFDIKLTILSTILFAAYTVVNARLTVATSRGAALMARFGVRTEVMGRFEQVLGQALALGFLVLMFFALYKFLPNRRVRWQAALLGGTFTAVLFEVAKSVFTAYVRSFNPGSLYSGTLYTIVIIVLWVYYSAFFFIIGGELGRVWELRRVRRLQRETFEERFDAPR